MLVFRRSKNESAVAGYDTSNNKIVSPFQVTITDINDNRAKTGFQSFLPNGEESELLKVDRYEIARKICEGRDSGNTETMFNVEKPKSEDDNNLFLDFLKDKLNFDSFENFKRNIEKVKGKESQLQRFIYLIKNGAFFKHWADHYTKQAQEMASSLELAA
jgi:hypothetical protein